MRLFCHTYAGKPAHRTAQCIFLWLWTILATSGLAQASTAALDIPPGLEYVHRRLGTGPLSVHILKIDRARARFSFTTSLAQNTVYDLQPLSQQIEAVTKANHVPVAGVNGDFFRIRTGPYQGDPLGLQICNGELISSPGNTCFWLDTQQGPHIAEVYARFRVTWPDGTSIPFDINQELKQDRAVLYTPTMGRSTRTESALELVLENDEASPWLPVKPGRTYRARVVSVNRDPNSVIPAHGLVLSLSGSVGAAVKTVTPGTVLSLSLRTSPDLTGVETAIGGGPLLVSKSTKRTFTGNQPRHPRTAIGWNPTHYFLLVVDGRQKDLSVGMSLPELADMMHDLGCTDAMNLDGGGSSTFWLAGTVMNSPSDGRERRVANGLILLQRRSQ